MVKNPPANAGDEVLILGLGRFPGGGHGNPLQYSCLENPMDRGAWWATDHGVAESDTTEHAQLLLLATLIVNANETYNIQLLLSPTVCKPYTKHVFKFIYIFTYLTAADLSCCGSPLPCVGSLSCSMWDLSFLTRDRTWVPCTGSSES